MPRETWSRSNLRTAEGGTPQWVRTSKSCLPCIPPSLLSSVSFEREGEKERKGTHEFTTPPTPRYRVQLERESRRLLLPHFEFPLTVPHFDPQLGTVPGGDGRLRPHACAGEEKVSSGEKAEDEGEAHLFRRRYGPERKPGPALLGQVLRERPSGAVRVVSSPA